MAKIYAINFATTEEQRNCFNSAIAAKGLKTKEVMNAFVNAFIKTPKEVIDFLGLNDEK